MEEQRLSEALNRTGFVLEYKIQHILREHGWHVLSSRYYPDDVTGLEREIDVVATRFASVDEFTACTVLVISCKKTAASSWVFMTDQHDPNVEEYPQNPMQVISNRHEINVRLMYEKQQLIDELLTYENAAAVHHMPHRVFAQQQINNNSYNPEDDKKIYDSISTTIKAACYEARDTAGRLQKAQVVNFHLLSVHEGGIVEMYFGDDTQHMETVQEVNMVSKHIVGKSEGWYKVHFIDADAFESVLSRYDALAGEYAVFWQKQIDAFYDQPFSDVHKQRMECQWENFASAFACAAIDCDDYWHDVFNNTDLSKYEYDEGTQLLTLSFDLKLFSGRERIVDELNHDENIQMIARRLLKEYFRYEGAFQFTFFVSNL